MPAIRFKPQFQLTRSTAVADEVALAMISAGWALLLWLPLNTFPLGSGFKAVENVIGGEIPLACILTLLVAAQIAAFFYRKWPPHWRLRTLFIAALWWTWVAMEAMLGRWQSPAWITTAGVAALAYMTWMRARRVALITWPEMHTFRSRRRQP